MPKGYFLSESDQRGLQQMIRWWRGGGAGKSSRPTPTRRTPRGFGGGGKRDDGNELAAAIIKGTVPEARDITTSGNLITGNNVITPGELDAQFTDTTFESGALLINADGFPLIEEVDGVKTIRVLSVRNHSYTSFHGIDEGIANVGIVSIIPGETEGDAPIELFSIGWPDNQAQPAYDLGVDPAVDQQVLRHLGGQADFELTTLVDCN